MLCGKRGLAVADWIVMVCLDGYMRACVSASVQAVGTRAVCIERIALRTGVVGLTDTQTYPCTMQ